MTPIEAALLLVLLFLPFHWLVRQYFARLEDPTYLRRHGIIVTSESALESHSPAIGHRFDHVLDPHKRERILAGELYLEPGLVYVVL